MSRATAGFSATTAIMRRPCDHREPRASPAPPAGALIARAALGRYGEARRAAASGARRPVEPVAPAIAQRNSTERRERSAEADAPSEAPLPASVLRRRYVQRVTRCLRPPLET